MNEYTIYWGHTEARRSEIVTGTYAEAKLSYKLKVGQAESGLLINSLPVGYVRLTSFNGLSLQWTSDSMMAFTGVF